jgi:hypothetical protein
MWLISGGSAGDLARTDSTFDFGGQAVFSLAAIGLEVEGFFTEELAALKKSTRRCLPDPERIYRELQRQVPRRMSERAVSGSSRSRKPGRRSLDGGATTTNCGQTVYWGESRQPSSPPSIASALAMLGNRRRSSNPQNLGLVNSTLAHLSGAGQSACGYLAVSGSVSLTVRSVPSSVNSRLHQKGDVTQIRSSKNCVP